MWFGQFSYVSLTLSCRLMNRFRSTYSRVLAFMQLCHRLNMDKLSSSCRASKLLFDSLHFFFRSFSEASQILCSNRSALWFVDDFVSVARFSCSLSKSLCAFFSGRFSLLCHVTSSILCSKLLPFAVHTFSYVLFVCGAVDVSIGMHV